ncbi:MAG: nitrophenyl compound nitroreductase subunit ArsF family protein [Pirellulaceae bacterium]
MNAKNAISAALLVFVVVSLGVAVADVTGLTARGTSSDGAVASLPRTAACTVYYLHGNTRCDTCRNIEAYTHDALAQDIQAGNLDWRVVNYEEPAYQQYATRFELVAPSVVLVDHRTQPERWRELGQVWQLVDDRTTFVTYVQAEWREFAAASHTIE